MKKIPNEIYISQEDLGDRLNVDGEVNTALVFAKPIEGVQMTRFVNDEAKWHKITPEDDIPHCDRYNEVVLIAFGAHKDEKAFFSANKIYFWDTYGDRSLLRYAIKGLSDDELFGDIYWANVKDFFPKFNK